MLYHNGKGGVTDILRPSLKAYRAVRFAVMDPKVQREASRTVGGFRQDSFRRLLAEKTKVPFLLSNVFLLVRFRNPTVSSSSSRVRLTYSVTIT